MKRIMTCTVMALAVISFSSCSIEPDAAAGGGATSTVELQNRSDGVAGALPSNELEKMTAEAQSLEAAFEFAAAAEVWDSISAQVESQFGPDAWQAMNPGYNAHLARVQAGFDEQRMRVVREVSRLVDEMSASTTSVTERIELLEAAIGHQEQLFGTESAIVGKQNLNLAAVKHSAGDRKGAIACYHKGVDILRENFCTAHPEIVASISMLGQLYLEEREYRTAIANYKQATKMAEVLWGEMSAQYARQANQLGVAYYQGGQLETAEQTLKATEVIRRNVLGEEHVLVAHSLLNLGVLYIDTRNYDGATGCLSRAVAIFDADDSSTELLNESRNKLSIAYMLTGRPELAEPLLDQMLGSQRREMGGDHPETAAAEFRYAIALARQGKYELAEPLFQQAMASQRKNLGVNNSETIKTMQAYAMLLTRTGREDDARQLTSEIQRVASRPDNSGGPLLRRP